MNRLAELDSEIADVLNCSDAKARMNQNTEIVPTLRLLDESALERSETVANARMNRVRNLNGGNSYEKDLGLAPLNFLKKALRRQDDASWLDLCCGTGRALLQAAEVLQSDDLDRRVKIIGIDLVPMFDRISPTVNSVHLVTASVENWTTQEKFDLITCVHGLHYIGDKLGLLQRATGWLKKDGLLMMNVDYRNLRITGQMRSGPQIGRGLRRIGFKYVPSRHLLMCSGNINQHDRLPFRYLGGDDKAGPNYTGQPAVDSYYEGLAK